MDETEIVDIQPPSGQDSQPYWSQLARAQDKEVYARAWLALMFQQIDSAIAGIVVLRDVEQFRPLAQWPDDVQDIERLADIIDEVISEGCGLLSHLAVRSPQHDSDNQHYALAYPVLIEKQVAAVVALEVVSRDKADLAVMMQNLQWGSAWIELLLRRQRSNEASYEQKQLSSSVDLLATVMNEAEYTAAAMALATELAHLMEADRVSVGFWQKNSIYIEAISHTADFTKRMNLIRYLAQAMEEAIEQRHVINFSFNTKNSAGIILAHEELSRQHGAGHILTIPLYQQGKYYAAVTLERPVEMPFTQAQVNYTQALLGLAGTALYEKRQNDKPLYKKILCSAKTQWQRLVGPQYAGRKLFVSLSLLLLVFFTFATGVYRVNADVTIEGAVRRVISTPFNGYISESLKRAGDIVKANEVLAKLDDRDLRLERIKWASQYAQYQRQHQEALARRNRAQVNILDAQMQQAKAQLDLANSRLSRTNISAPFAGLIVKGDLSQRLGAAVQQGEVLFEITPLDNYRVILQVDERRIADIKTGQRGPLVLSALPEEEYYFVVEKILPTTTVNDGENLFRVEARLENPSERLHPGMKGIGKVEVESRRLISIWTQGLREWLDLQAWKWFGL